MKSTLILFSYLFYCSILCAQKTLQLTEKERGLTNLEFRFGACAYRSQTRTSSVSSLENMLIEVPTDRFYLYPYSIHYVFPKLRLGIGMSYTFSSGNTRKNEFKETITANHAATHYVTFKSQYVASVGLGRTALSFFYRFKYKKFYLDPIVIVGLGKIDFADQEFYLKEKNTHNIEVWKYTRNEIKMGFVQGYGLELGYYISEMLSLNFSANYVYQRAKLGWTISMENSLLKQSNTLEHSYSTRMQFLQFGLTGVVHL